MEQGAREDTTRDAEAISKKCLTPPTTESTSSTGMHKGMDEYSIDVTVDAGEKAKAIPTSIASSTTLQFAHQGASEGNAEAVQAAGKDEATPRSSKVVTLTPTSSGKRSLLRRVSSGGSPSAGRGIGSLSMGFGAGLRNIPTPIATQVQPVPDVSIQALALREPIPGSPLPGIEEKLGQLAAAEPSQPQNQVSRPLPPMTPGRTTTVRDKGNRRATLPTFSASIPPQQLTTRPSQHVNSYVVNPYVHRADTIGPGHRLPGIGHLGELLTPPGWVPGTDPITTAEAMKLFQESRMRATAVLNLAVKRPAKKLSAEEQEKRDLGWQKTWDNQLKLDQIVYGERKKIFEDWQAAEAKSGRGQQAGLQRQYRPGDTPPGILPRPHDPPTGTSAYAYTQYMQSQLHTSPHVHATNPPLSAGSGSIHDRLQELQRNLHFPLQSPMSPGTLDPSLVPETLQSVYGHYSNNRSVILEMQKENEMFLATWCAKFGAPMPHSPRGFGSAQPGNDQYAQPLAAIQNGYVPRHPNGWDTSQARLEGARVGISQVHAPGAPSSQPYQRFLGLSQGNPGHDYFNASSGPLNSSSPHPQGENKGQSSDMQVAAPPSAQVYPRQPYFRVEYRPINRTSTPGHGKDMSPERKDLKANIAQPTKATITQISEKEDTKPQSWYHDAMAAADLPTSVISQQAMQAGVEFRPSVYKQQGPNKPNPRNGTKSKTTQQRGFTVKPDAVQAFLNMGVVDATKTAPIAPPVRQPNPKNAFIPRNGSLTGCVPPSNNGNSQQYGSFPNYASYHYTARPQNDDAQQYGTRPSYLSQYQPASVAQAQSSVESAQQNEDTISAPNSAALSTSSTQPSSDAPDDPKDLTFGKRVLQRKPSATRAAPASRKPSEGTKRRNSKPTETVAKTSKKRVRHSLDGAADKDGSVWAHFDLLQ